MTAHDEIEHRYRPRLDYIEGEIWKGQVYMVKSN